MGCSIKNPTNGKKSELFDRLKNIFKDEREAEVQYAKLTGRNFKNRFGDWEWIAKNPNAKDEDVLARSRNITKEEALFLLENNPKSSLDEIYRFKRLGKVNSKTNEPLLFHSVDKDMWFFYDKNGDKDYIDKMKLSEFSSQEIEEVSNHLLHRFVIGGGKKSLNQYDISELESKKISESINESIQAYRESIKGLENEETLRSRIDLVEKNKDEFRKELINLIDSLGLKVRERITDENGNPVTEVSEENKSSGLNIGESYETNSKETATVNTKIMLSQIENRVEVDGESLPVKDGFLEIESFANFNDVWNTLNEILVDNVGYGYGESVRDIYDVMYDRIVDFEGIKPWISDLLDKLENLKASGDNNKITEFVQAFTKTELNYFVTQTDNGDYQIINATSTNSKQSQITQEWMNSFQDIFLTDGVLKSDQRQKLINVGLKNKKAFESWGESYRLAEKNQEPLRSEEILDKAYMKAIDDIVSIMNDLGVDGIFDDDIDDLVMMKGGQGKRKFIIDELFKQTRFMLRNSLDKNFSFKTEDGGIDNIFNKESFIKAFAYTVGFRNGDNSDSSILLNQGKTAYSISNPTYVSNKLNEWKAESQNKLDIFLETNEEIETSLDLLTSDVSKKNSSWLNYLLANEIENKLERITKSKERIEDFKTGLDSSFKSKGRNNGVDNVSITTNDQINANVVQMLNKKLGGSNKSYFPTIIAADKSRRILFEGLPMFDSGIKYRNGEFFISEKSVDLATGYFIDEYNRMKLVNRENSNDDVQKIVHYHGKEGNGVKSQIFPEFNQDSNDPKFKELRDSIYGESFNEAQFQELTPSQLETIKKFVKESIKERVEEHSKFLKDLDGLSPKLIQKYGSIETLSGDYFMNGLISSVEYTKLFSGDPAYYKNGADLIKRIPSTYTDGLPLRIEDGDNLFFNQATVSGVEVPSRFLNMIKSSLKDKSIADAYKEVNTTDAQAWITPRRWRFLKKKLGQWGPQHDKVYRKMFTGQSMTPNEAKIAAQPLKGVYFETNQLGSQRPVYLKYSQAVLIPSLIKGTPMEGLLNKMQGSTNVDSKGNVTYEIEAHKEVHEVVTIDGIKVGAVEPTKIHKDETTVMLGEEDIKLNPQVLNNRGWKLQQDLPIKLMHDTNVGSQIQKNIFEGLDPKGTYDFEGGLNGNQLAKRMHETVSKLSNIGKDELKNELGIDADGNMSDKDFIYKSLIQEFKDRGGNDNVVEALQKNLPFDAIPQIRGKVESIFMSIMNRRLTKISTEGGSFIQVSPFGLEDLGEESGIIPLDKRFAKEGGLLPPRIEDGKFLPGQAMIPHSQAVKILKKHNISLANRTMEEAMSLLDPSVLELITYRIPNQGMSSNDYLQIVGILPPGVGDSIVVYDGLPAKTGSDFDIDKLFVMQNHVVFDSKNKRLTKLTKENSHLAVKTPRKKSYIDKSTGNVVPAVEAVLYSDFEIEKMLTQNDLVAQYKAVLSSKSTYDSMMRSIDGAQLKDDIAGNKKKGIEALFPSPTMGNMELFSPLTQLKVKSEYLSGKMGVGQTANQLVDHVMNQMLNIEFKSYIGVGNVKKVKTSKGKEKNVTFFDSETTGIYSIADNLSAFLNAYVDIAKDPYITRGNHNSITANTTFMLLRAGVPLKWVNRFIGQPIIKELVQLQLESQSITAEDIVVNKEKGSAIEKIRDKYGWPLFPDKITGDTVSQFNENNLEKNIKDDSYLGDSDFNYEVLKAWKFLQEKGKAFGQAVVASKSDTAGSGGSNIDRLVNYNKIEKVVNEDIVQNYRSKFEGTMLGTYADNTLNWTRDVIRKSGLFMSGTAEAEIAFNSISFQTGNGDLLVDAELGKSIDNNYYSYIMSGLSFFENNFNDYKNIMSRVPKMVKDMKKSGTTNYLINEFEIQERKGQDYLGINNKNKPTYTQNQIYRSWMNLYETYYKNEDGSLNKKDIHPDRKLAIDLVKYAYTASGFQNNLSQFFTHIPHQILKDNNISAEIRDALRKTNEMIVDDVFVDQFQRHNKDNPKVVKSVKLEKMELIGSAKSKAYGFIYKPAKNKSQDISSKNVNGPDFFPKFVRAKVKKSQYGKNTPYLFEKIGTVDRVDAEGKNIKAPVYIRTFELGSSEGKFKTFEYSKGNAIVESNIESNNLTPKGKIITSSLRVEAESMESFKDLNDKDINQSTIDAKRALDISNIEIIQSNLEQILEDKKISCK